MRLMIMGLACIALFGCSGPEDTPVEADTTAPAPAEQATVALPGWLPDAVYLPEDFEPVTVRALGSSTRLLQGRTAMATDTLLERNSQSLSTGGYTVRTLEADARLLFSGQDIEQGSISIADTMDKGRLLQIDLQLSSP